MFPWFILGFVTLAIINSFGLIPEYVSSVAKDISKFLMVSALAAIGLNTSFKDMKKSGEIARCSLAVYLPAGTGVCEVDQIEVSVAKKLNVFTKK